MNDNYIKPFEEMDGHQKCLLFHVKALIYHQTKEKTLQEEAKCVTCSELQVKL